MFKTADTIHADSQNTGYFTRRADELANEGNHHDALVALADAIEATTRVLHALKAAEVDITDARLDAFIAQSDALLAEGGN